SRTPIVMAHGFLASGDTWGKHVQRFVANGYCPSRFHAFDWNSLDRTADHVQELERLIDDVLLQNNADAVDLWGHSAGGGLGYRFLEQPERAAKVRKYVHIGSYPEASPAGPIDGESIPTLNLWSPADLIVEGADIPGATNVSLPNTDHYAVATSEGSFQAIYEFLEDRSPKTLRPRSKDRVQVEGRLLTFGENQPVVDGEVTVWALNPETGDRIEESELFAVGDDGSWGPMEVSSKEQFEFVASTANQEDAPVRYFLEPFKADQKLTYLRTFPGPGSIAGLLLNLIPREREKVSLVIFNASRAFLAGTDSLTLDGQELLTEASASAENTSIALFVFDIDRDDEPGGTSAIFDMFPFLAAIDLPITASEGEFMTLDFNGRRLILPRSPGDEGILIAVYQ
ncbi:MAG: alpha/beta fold hydrolase, partial [Myxococcota bacterium]|nr:alpha/beta fold hydrolase [Myxococcota bacterium]